jgi:hypothetical protein
MSDTSFKSVWDAIEDDPAQAAKMKHRSAHLRPDAGQDWIVLDRYFGGDACGGWNRD